MSKKAIAERRLEVVYRDPFDLKPDPRNARTHSPEQIEQLRASIREFGFTNPVLLRPDGMIGAGHGRVEAAKAEKLNVVPTCVVEGLTTDQWRAYVLADNRLALNAGWDEDLLRAELAALAELEVDLSRLGFDDGELDRLLDQAATDAGDSDGAGPSGAGSLAERFGIPPFSVLNAREGWWQDRKRAWLALGIQSELGRGEQLIPNGGGLGSKARYDGGGASPGGSMRPAADYGKTKARGDGRGRSVQSPPTRPAS